MIRFFQNTLYNEALHDDLTCFITLAGQQALTVLQGVTQYVQGRCLLGIIVLGRDRNLTDTIADGAPEA